MRCPSCKYVEDKVVDSRPTPDGRKIKRRRECLNCGYRFTTYETIETAPLLVIKKDNTREPFDREKVLKSIIRACDKRTVSMTEMEAIVSEIENSLRNSLRNEVKSSDIGELVMQHLKKLDKVAYVRFASVYWQFNNIDELMEELRNLQNE
ncbi:MAG: transcriptional repressor NrdR [Clostridia bacterium]|nr:transcriptional repressor NrdR [Clostridia bacterium]